MSQQYIFKKPTALDNPYIFKNDINQSKYYNRRNPFIEGNLPFINDIAKRKDNYIQRTAEEKAEIISYIQELIQPRLDRGEKYFTEQTKYFQLSMHKKLISEHFKAQGIDIKIASNRSTLLVFATNKNV